MTRRATGTGLADVADPAGHLPLVSVVTPTLQRAEYLERTLRSVRAQTYPNIEHIVVDGGSSDGTLDLLRRYEKTYNLRWISEPDDGMYDAINKGLRMAGGEILAYLNSDDLYFPWTVAVAVESLDRDPLAGLVFGDTIRVNEIRGWTVPVFVAPMHAFLTPAHGNLHQPAVLWRRAVFEALGGFDARLAYVADLDFWLRAIEQFRFVKAVEFLALEQWHAGMFSETRRGEMAAEEARVRAGHRRGLAGSRVGKLAAYVRWHWSSGRSWLRFVRASRTRKGGWTRTIETCGPTVATPVMLVGFLPSKGSRLRRSISWAADPLSVASAADLGREP